MLQALLPLLGHPDVVLDHVWVALLLGVGAVKEALQNKKKYGDYPMWRLMLHDFTKFGLVYIVPPVSAVFMYLWYRRKKLDK